MNTMKRTTKKELLMPAASSPFFLTAFFLSLFLLAGVAASAQTADTTPPAIVSAFLSTSRGIIDVNFDEEIVVPDLGRVPASFSVSVAGSSLRSVVAPPGAPTGLTVSEPSPGVAEATWIAPLNNGGSPITGYRIERATGASGNFMNIITSSSNFGIFGNVFLGEPGLRSVTTYRYRVFAINNDGESSPSDVVSITTRTRVPDPPSNLTATSTRPDEITLNWMTPADDGGTPIIGYHIKRVTLPSSQPTTTLVANAGVVTSYTDTVSAGTNYGYEVFAISTLTTRRTLAMPSVVPLQSLSSGRVDVTSASPAIAPDAPTGLMGAVRGQSQIDLTWTASLRNGGAPITGYRIERSSQTSFAALVVAGSTTLGVTEFIDNTGLDPGSTYHYRIKAVNSAGNSAPSNTFSGTTRASNTVPDAPTGLMEVVQGRNQIDLTWTAPFSNGGSPITGYRIERATGTGGNFMDLVADTMDPATTSYNDTGLMVATTYRYRVSTINALGTGAASNTVTAMTIAPTAPSAPRAFSLVPAENATLNRNNVTLNWLPPLDDGGAPITGYIIERYASTITVGGVIKDPSDATFDTRNSPNPTATSYTDATMQLNQATYLYRIRAVNQNGLEGPELPTLARESSYRVGIANVIVLSAAPTGLTGVAQGQNQIDLTWTVPEDFGALGSSSFTGYRIERATGTSGNFMELAANTMDSATSYNDVGLMAATTYRYRVSAVNTFGSGDVSNVATVTTAALTAAPSISISPATLIATVGNAITTNPITITNTGGAVASYSISPNLNTNTGLDFDTSTGSISGTPTMAASALTYTITATNSVGSNSAMVTISVQSLPVPNISVNTATLIATVGTVIADITIDASAGGAVTSYSISPNLNANTGLSFNTANGIIFGTPTMAANALTYIITATNSAGSNSTMVTISVQSLPAPDISASVTTLTATVGTVIADITIDASAGGTVDTYSISPPIVNGLSFDANTGSISGTPTAVANAVTYTITATNSVGMNTASVAITVNAVAPIIRISPRIPTFTVGTAIPPTTITNSGGAVTSYSIMPNLNATTGLSFNTTNGIIFGTPTTVAALTPYTITATNSGGSSSDLIIISVQAALAAPNISINPATLTANLGIAITPTTINNTGGAVPAIGGYSISPPIANGLGFDANAGEIFGTPTSRPANVVIYTITATNTAGMNSASVAITIQALSAPNISPSVTTLTATAGTLITPITITNNGGAVPANGYSINPSIANGFSFDANTGEISGTPTMATNAVTYTITATNTAGMNSASVAITVQALSAPNISPSVTTLTATAGTLIIPITIMNNGGAVPAINSYSINPSIANGLSFDANTGEISGTPTAGANAVTYTITATNNAGMNTAMVNISVLVAPDISASVTTLTATAGTLITPITIMNNGGAVPATNSYSINPSIANGLSFDANTGEISGTPTAGANAVTYTITATNTAGMNTAMVTITVQALTAPDIFLTSSSLNAGVGITITPTTITNLGGVATYSISPGLPPGLSIDATTGSISGTPTMTFMGSSYTITASNSAGSDTATIYIDVLAAPDISASVTTLTATAGTLITPITITNNGGAVSIRGAYSINPPIANGLSFDTDTGEISGTPTAGANAVTYTITATGPASTGSVMVIITVNATLAAPDISASVPTLTATQAVAITPITIMNNGGAVPANGYSINPSIANGFSFDANTGEISGTPTAVANAVTYTITATNTAGMNTAMVTITVQALTAPNIFLTSSSLNAGVGITITPTTITNLGGAATYSISPGLPPGLSIDATTGSISGTPTMTFMGSSYTITASNSAGSDTATIYIDVLAAPDISASVTTLTATAGTLITPITITNNGGAVSIRGAYSINPPIANGLSFDTDTGEISGTPTAGANAVTYTITATGPASTGSVMVIITVNATLAAPDISASVPTLTATQAVAITPITIMNNGGAVPANGYSINPSIANGFSFDANTGEISGTPTAVANAVTYTITATNTAGMNTAMVTITVNVAVADTTPPVITLSGNAQETINQGASYTDAGAMANDNLDGNITSNIIPTITDASGNTIAAIDANTPVGTYTITYNVMDAAGNTATPMTRIVTVTVATADTTPPVITLTGANPLTIATGTAYTEPGATATDNVDGDITSAIVIDASAVNTSVAGTYSVTYNVSDNAGNPAVQVSRTVMVTATLPAPNVSIALFSITPTHAEVGQTVTISGLGLSGTSAVFFGSVAVSGANINVQSDNLMTAIVPAGATHGSITVLNNGLMAQSSQQFYISFSGTASTNTEYDSEFELSTGEVDIDDICLCDLNGDGKSDITLTHKHEVAETSTNPKSEITIFRNESTAGTTRFSAAININNAQNKNGFIATTCADLDGDGKPELIFTADQGTSLQHIYVYKNESAAGAITMTPLELTTLKLPQSSGNNRIARRVKAFDMDGDGKNDLVVGNDTDNTLHIFRNTGSGTGNFSFEPSSELGAGNNFSGNILVIDINNDGKLDIISAPFRAQSQQSTSISEASILKNNSTTGRFSFSLETTINNGTDRISSLSSGDFDQDGLNDIVIASRDGGSIKVYQNTSNGSLISFGNAIDIDLGTPSPLTPFGVDLGDVNGDGLVDIVSSFASRGIALVPNNSTIPNNAATGTIAFRPAERLATSTTTQNICVGDLNADAKPDIAFTLDVNPGSTGKLGVFMNRNLIVPSISPSDGPFCRNDAFNITATKSTSSTYDWRIMTPAVATITNNGDNADIEVTSADSPVTIQVEITQTGSMGSNPVTIEYIILNGPMQQSPPTVSFSPSAPAGGVVCFGEPFILGVPAATGGYMFEWTRPNGSTSTGSQINIATASTEDAGNYTVRVMPPGGCFTEMSTPFNVKIEKAPLRIISNQGCATTSASPAITLDIGNSGAFNYSWKRDRSPISETSTTIQASMAGSYTVEVSTRAGMCVTESEPFIVPEFTTSQFDLETMTCVNSPIQLTSNTVSDNAFTSTEMWEVLNGINPISPSDTSLVSPGDILNFSFNQVGTYTIRLTSEYRNFEICPDILEKEIIVTDPPVITFNVADGVEKCQLDGLTVGIKSPSSADIASYEWSVNGSLSSASTVEATTPIGMDSVYAILTITTTIGCQVRDSVKVKNFPSDADISSTSTAFDPSTDTVTLEDDNFITLTAENIVSGIAWSPKSIIDDTTATTITIFPSLTTTTVTLHGTDAGGCAVVSTLTIILDNIRPRRTFSPNGDGLGFDCWEILNSTELQGCKVYVFDARGKNILVQDSPFPENCVWDGNYNGTPVPEGLYYFVLKCDKSDFTKSGSILLAR